jgi:hypothetical protein
LSLRLGLLLIGIILSFPSATRAHEEPGGCLESNAAIDIFTFRSDGVTPLIGTIAGCEQFVYRANLQKPADQDAFCAFSGGTFTLTTPDGVLHTLSADVPCIGGNTGLEGCFDAINFFTGESIAYTVSPTDVHNGTITAKAVYAGGVVHDNDIADTPGLVTVVLRTTPVTGCEATTTVTTSSSTTSTTAIPKSICASLKVEAAFQLGSDLGACDARALKFGASVREECRDEALATFQRNWATAERRNDCLTTGDQASVAMVMEQCAGTVEQALVP